MTHAECALTFFAYFKLYRWDTAPCVDEQILRAELGQRFLCGWPSDQGFVRQYLEGAKDNVE